MPQRSFESCRMLALIAWAAMVLLAGVALILSIGGIMASIWMWSLPALLVMQRSMRWWASEGHPLSTDQQQRLLSIWAVLVLSTVGWYLAIVLLDSRIASVPLAVQVVMIPVVTTTFAISATFPMAVSVWALIRTCRMSGPLLRACAIVSLASVASACGERAATVARTAEVPSARAESVATFPADSAAALRCVADETFKNDPAQPTSQEVRAAEQLRLAETSGRVSRSGDTLTVRLRNGGTDQSIDCLVSVDEFARYEFVGSGPRGRGFIFEVSGYEGGGFFWLDDSTGTVSPFASAPVYSPDSSRIAIANEDLEASYTENVFEIWAVRAGSVERELREEGGSEWGASLARWDDDSTVSFHVNRLTADSISRESRVAERRAGAWTTRVRRP